MEARSWSVASSSPRNSADALLDIGGMEWSQSLLLANASWNYSDNDCEMVYLVVWNRERYEVES